MSTAPVGSLIGQVYQVNGECYVIPYTPSLAYSGLSLAQPGQELFQGDTLVCYNGGSIYARFDTGLLNVTSNSGPTELTGWSVPSVSALDFIGSELNYIYSEFAVPILGDLAASIVGGIQTLLDVNSWAAYFDDLDWQPWWYDGYFEEFYPAGGGGGGDPGGCSEDICPIQY